MQILNNRPPELDPSDVKKSFREINRYLTSTMETIDFNLAKNRRNILSSDGSAEGLQSQINLIKGDLYNLTNSLNDTSNQINSIMEQIQTINTSLVNLDARVKALENQGT